MAPSTFRYARACAADLDGAVRARLKLALQNTAMAFRAADAPLKRQRRQAFQCSHHGGNPEHTTSHATRSTKPASEPILIALNEPSERYSISFIVSLFRLVRPSQSRVSESGRMRYRQRAAAMTGLDNLWATSDLVALRLGSEFRRDGSASQVSADTTISPRAPRRLQPWPPPNVPPNRTAPAMPYLTSMSSSTLLSLLGNPFSLRKRTTRPTAPARSRRDDSAVLFQPWPLHPVRPPDNPNPLHQQPAPTAPACPAPPPPSPTTAP